MRISTYNILSSYYVQNTASCPRAFISHSHRWMNMDRILTSEVKQQAIVCLQELSPQQKSDLHKFFFDHRYSMVTSDYGNMCVAIAFPFEKYKMKRYFEQTISRLPHLLQFGFTQQNRLLSLILSEKEHPPFCVATYHAPCKFKEPFVMTAHICSAMELVQLLSNGSPYVFAGDFNMTPQNEQYQLLLQGTSQIKPSRSVYQGREPTTTHCKVFGKEFKNTLDYIFVGDGVAVTSVDNLEEPGVIPNESQPSDHILLGAELELS